MRESAVVEESEELIVFVSRYFPLPVVIAFISLAALVVT